MLFLYNNRGSEHITQHCETLVESIKNISFCLRAALGKVNFTCVQ